MVVVILNIFRIRKKQCKYCSFLSAQPICFVRVKERLHYRSPSHPHVLPAVAILSVEFQENYYLRQIDLVLS